MRQPPPSDSQIYEVYIDESSQNNHRYLVLGGIVTAKVNVADFVEMMWERRAPQLPAGEMKWNKVSRSKLAAYKTVIDAFFAWGNAIHFHALIVDTTKQQHRLYNEGNREIGFNKEVYQLAMKCGRLYPRTLFHVYPDHRTTDQRPEDLRLMLNRGIYKAGDRRDWPFRRVQFRDSRKTEILQIADIFAGAIAHRLNGHEAVPGASPAKHEMCEHILAQAGVVDVCRDTSVRGKFTIWHRQLK